MKGGTAVDGDPAPREDDDSERGHLVRAWEAQRIAWIAGTEHVIALDGAGSKGRLTVLRSRFTSGAASPLHVHPTQDETFCVLSGTLTIWVGDQKWSVGAGDTAFLPRGVPHTYLVGPSGAEVLTICTPSGMEEFFRAAGWDTSAQQPDGWQVDMGSLGEAAERTGQIVLGPPFGIDDEMPGRYLR